VLVIGGTGLMGAPTTRQLQAQGHRVVVMSRGSKSGQGAGGERPELAPCELLQCDREDEEAFLRALSAPGCPRVVVDFTAMRPRHIEAVLEAHRQRPLDHYVFISTNMVYPGGPEDMDVSGLPQPISEEAVNLEAADSAPDTYGGRKLRCERLLQQAAAEVSLPATTLRPPAVVGPGCDNRHERLQRLAAGLRPLPPPRSKRGNAARPGPFRVAYSEDVAAAACAVVARGRAVHGETFNVACAESLTLEQYLAAVANVLGHEAVPAPEDPILRNYEKQGELDVSKAERLLDFKSTAVADWMRETVAWHARRLDSSGFSSAL